LRKRACVTSPNFLFAAVFSAVIVGIFAAPLCVDVAAAGGDDTADGAARSDDPAPLLEAEDDPAALELLVCGFSSAARRLNARRGAATTEQLLLALQLAVKDETRAPRELTEPTKPIISEVLYEERSESADTNSNDLFASCGLRNRISTHVRRRRSR
jgi:hypothetical protein